VTKRYLADTHALLWFLVDPAQLAKKAAQAFDALGNGVQIHFSTVSLWEVAFLHDAGHIRLSEGFSAWCDALEGLPGMKLEPLLRGDVEEARSLRLLKDPFDRLIAGTALRLGVPLISRDTRMATVQGLRVVW
jgi:PIN domain nuclease of toxin-antitoxin system